MAPSMMSTLSINASTLSPRPSREQHRTPHMRPRLPQSPSTISPHPSSPAWATAVYSDPQPHLAIQGHHHQLHTTGPQTLPPLILPSNPTSPISQPTPANPINPIHLNLTLPASPLPTRGQIYILNRARLRYPYLNDSYLWMQYNSLIP